MTKARKRWFGVIYGVILVVVTLAGIEGLASFYAPAWPARALRSISPVNPDPSNPFNSWGMNDRERSMAKPADVTFRSVFVGDSFVEFAPNKQTLNKAVERRADEAGVKGFEAVGLGISGTGPRSYYFRTRDVALSLSPDALLVFFFSGNDFVRADESLNGSWIPPLVDESPGGSILGRIMPRTNWLLVNRLRLSEFLSGNKPIPDETKTLEKIVDGPPDQRVPGLVEHMKRFYYPNMSRQRLTEIFSRGGGSFWQAFEKRPQDHEYLMGWLPNLIVSAELRDDEQTRIRTPEDAAKDVNEAEIKATMSWLVGMNDLAKAHHVPIRVFLIPAANVSPDFVQFWRPWPKYFGWYLLSDARHQRLAEDLSRTDVPFVDLRKDFLGVPGAYRMSDAHWTEKGQAIAADRVWSELTKMMPRQDRTSGAK
jgi:hypothetical protein